LTSVLSTAVPFFTADLPGIGGKTKCAPEDFEVEEIPAYEPCGAGEFLYLWVEKRAMGAEYCTRQIAQRLGLPAAAVGTAGLKDRHAVTRQWISVPASAEPALPGLEGEGLRVLRVSRHNNKLRPGHLHGNRFKIVLRECAAGPELQSRVSAVVQRLRQQGMPNFYGAQRFGHGGETLELGMGLLGLGDAVKAPKRLNPFLRKLALSAVQSALFNDYLGRRMAAGELHRVLAGDVMAKWPFGGMFVAEDVAAEQARFDRREIVSAGPIFGRKTFPARGEAAEKELSVLAATGLTTASFARFGKLLMGTRRRNLVYVDDLAYAMQLEGVELSFTLPAGSYATMLVREVTKTDPGSDERAEDG
jgi:tRNA pseudouridine13 synthase